MEFPHPDAAAAPPAAAKAREALRGSAFEILERPLGQGDLGSKRQGFFGFRIRVRIIPAVNYLAG